MNYNEITTYEQTVELEENIKIKNKADKIYSDFQANVKLEVKNYKGEGRFKHWSDSNNSTSFVLKNDVFTFRDDYLHNTYILDVTPSAIFSALKSKEHNIQRSVQHLESAVRKQD